MARGPLNGIEVVVGGAGLAGLAAARDVQAAGGNASAELRALHDAGSDRVIDHLRWLGRPAPLLRVQTCTWEEDPWARGGYAFFDPAFDPALRSWLARPAGRVLFAGEHTSDR